VFYEKTPLQIVQEFHPKYGRRNPLLVKIATSGACKKRIRKPVVIAGMNHAKNSFQALT
jgi:hypothetical protein